MSPTFHRHIFVVMKSHPKRDHRKKRNRKGNKKVQKNCIMKNMNYCVFVDKNKPGSPNSWHVGIIGAEFSQVFFTCLEILGAETGVLEIPGHHISCWNPGIRVLSSWEFWGFYVFGGNPGGGDRSAGSPRSSHVLLKSLGQSSLKFWVFFTCLVETQGAETGVLWTQLGVSRLFTIGRKSWGQRCEMKINIFLGKRWDRLACSAVIIAQLDDLCIVFWASVFHNPSKWNIVQQCTRSAVDFERWHSYNNNINRAGKH